MKQTLGETYSQTKGEGCVERSGRPMETSKAPEQAQAGGPSRPSGPGSEDFRELPLTSPELGWWMSST